MSEIYITGGSILLALLWVGIMYNALVRGKNAVEEAWSGISVQLKRRHDLIPNLVGAVEKYMSHEKGLLESVTELRSAAIAAGVKNPAETAKAENMLTGALKSVFAVAESYPALRASENFAQLQQSLAETEDEIQMSRRYYNGTARDQNNRVKQFPGNLVASGFGFRPVEYFELDSPADREVPKVS